MTDAIILGLPERFWAKVAIDDRGFGTPCLIWTGCKVSNGYGQLTMKGWPRYAHRAAYQAQFGPIPDGLQLDHLCRNRDCVNPDHLEPVTQRENILRGTGSAAARARQTHCINGHAFTPENTIRRRDRPGRRECRTCHNAEMRQRRAKEKGSR